MPEKQTNKERRKDYQKGLQGLLVNYHLTFPVIKRQIIWIL